YCAGLLDAAAHRSVGTTKTPTSTVRIRPAADSLHRSQAHARGCRVRIEPANRNDRASDEVEFHSVRTACLLNVRVPRMKDGAGLYPARQATPERTGAIVSNCTLMEMAAMWSPASVRFSFTLAALSRCPLPVTALPEIKRNWFSFSC
ncbi:MAG: hypothetical protein ABIO17_09490, partial [Pseudoxanthomonas sp.]